MAVKPPWENERYADIVKPSVNSEKGAKKDSISPKNLTSEETHTPDTQPNIKKESHEHKTPVSNDEIIIIAKIQKGWIRTIVFGLVLLFSLAFLKVSPLIIQVIGLLISIAVFWFFVRLCLRVYTRTKAIIMIALMFVPMLNLLVVLIVLLKVNKLLRSKGFRVGLMGANI